MVRRVLLLLLAATLASCELERRAGTEYTNTGQELGPRGFRTIAAYESKVSFVGDDPAKRREAETLTDRYVERITFKNNAALRYERLYAGGYVARDTPTDMIQAMLGGKFYKDRGIVFERAKIKSTSGFTYLVQSSPTDRCFVAYAFFGEGTNARQQSPGNQSISASICYRAAAKSEAALESEMVDILSRARYDDGTGNRARRAAAALPPLPERREAA